MLYSTTPHSIVNNKRGERGNLPRKGYTAVTVDERIYKRVKEFINKINEREERKVYRSVSHFVEEALIEFLKAHETK